MKFELRANARTHTEEEKRAMITASTSAHVPSAADPTITSTTAFTCSAISAGTY
ncbi:MAG: hypothetical protein MR654_08965 [Corynebacterium glucuronolyticum]|nr:hypothetical protein [Corynebacterium glucuronolyticum]